MRRGASGALQRRGAALAVEMRLFANTGVYRRRTALKLGLSVNAERDEFAYREEACVLSAGCETNPEPRHDKGNE